jgi:glycosyltransferase involved in cell wall biosynthesis
MTPHVSVVIPVHDQATRLRLTLAGLERQQDIAPSDYEVIVVDDGSSDDLPAVIREERRAAPYSLNVVTSHSRGARGVPRNAGAASARGEVLIFLDADAFPSPRLVRCHAEAQRARDGMALGDLWVIPGAEFMRNPGLPMKGETFFLPIEAARSGEARLEAHAQKGLYPHFGLWCGQLDELLDEGGVPFAWVASIPHNLSIRSGTFRALRGFDASLSHSEGWDLGIRAMSKGCPISLAHGARSFHLYHRRDGAANLERVYASEAELERRYPDEPFDLVRLWLDACNGDPYVPAELNLSSWREVWRVWGDPRNRAEAQRLFRWTRQVSRPSSQLDALLGGALNARFRARD